MNRLRSFRESFRRKKSDVSSQANNRAHQWLTDEASVRQGSCTFPIKYLGCVEVFESRGMPICEEALKVLRSTKRKSIRGTLFVTGDGLRVVDGETRGLIVDQTIEKVSFCAPDRNNERGFAYICRDGSTRRWMCHGFHAVGNTGERLSHAVGCAFAVCLERKQKRDREAAELAAAAALNRVPYYSRERRIVATNNNNNLQQQHNANGSLSNGNSIGNSFNHGTTTSLISAAASSHNQTNTTVTNNQNYSQNSNNNINNRSWEAPTMKPIINPYAIDRPHATPLMLQRQTSFRPLSNLRSQSPFKRQLSLRLIGPQASQQHQQQLQQLQQPIQTPNHHQQQAILQPQLSQQEQNSSSSQQTRELLKNNGLGTAASVVTISNNHHHQPEQGQQPQTIVQ